MKDTIREIIKNNLQKLSKDELVDALADICMVCPPLNIIDILSRKQEIKADTMPNSIQHVDTRFAKIEQSLTKLENGLKK